jgi:integrase
VLCTYLGCRVGTALAITPGLVDLEEQRIRIPAMFPGNKTKLEMLLPIQPEFFEILKDLLRTRDKDPAIPLVGSHFLTYTEANLTHGFKDYVRSTGIDPGSRGPHALRHSFCSLMTALGQSPFMVMALVGHLSAQVHKNYTQSAVLYERAVATWPRRGRFYLRTNPPATVTNQVAAG